jgi:RNA polymerase sigma-70 factor, ECF subfamily
LPGSGIEAIPDGKLTQDTLYEQAAEAYGSSLDRLARAYEYDSETRRYLLQEIHLHLWRSLENFAGRGSLRTWVYRVAEMSPPGT